MIIVLSEFTVELEHFSAFKVKNTVLGWALFGFCQGEWRELYLASGEEDAREKKVLLDDGIMASLQGCPDCGGGLAGIRLVEDECCEDDEGSCGENCRCE